MLWFWGYINRNPHHDACIISEWGPSAAPVKPTQSLTGWNRSALNLAVSRALKLIFKRHRHVLSCRKFWTRSYVSCIRWRMKSSMVRSAFFPQYFLDVRRVNTLHNNSFPFLFCSQPSDTKSAESVHPNLTGATAGGEREAGGGCTERRAGGMFSQCFCRLQRRCANIWVCWTAKQKRRKKQTENMEQMRCVWERVAEEAGRWTRKLKRTEKEDKTMRSKMERRTVALSLVWWFSLCT